jgi:hypothetical protein
MARAEGERLAGSTTDWKEKAATYTVNPPLTADTPWKVRAAAFVINTPKTAEALWYRELFHDAYPEAAAAAAAPAMWMPRFVKGATDPSARTLKLYTTSS